MDATTKESRPYSYGVAGECDCASGISGAGSSDDGTCGSCANAAHPGCIFVEAGKQIVDVQLPGGAAVRVERWTNNTCKSTATLADDTEYVWSSASGGVLGKMKFTDANTRWYWEQCALPGFWFAAAAFGALAVGLVACVALACFCCRRAGPGAGAGAGGAYRDQYSNQLAYQAPVYTTVRAQDGKTYAVVY